MDIEQNVVDDQGTDQSEARRMLNALCDNGFEGDMDAAGVVLGRTSGDLREMAAGDVEIDDDLAMKIRAVARERGIEL